jgi:tetratricopeptide (TPR) repeat protein
LQEVAYQSLPFKLRRELHMAVGLRLEHDLGRELDADPAVLSHHFSLAGDHARAHRYAIVAAERATERFSHADAARLYRMAIEAGRADGVAQDPDAVADAWEQLGEALRCAGEPDAAMQALREARRLLIGDPIAQARLCHRHAKVAGERDSPTAAVRWLNRGLRAIDGIESVEATRWRARLHSFLAGARNRQGRWSEAARLCHEAILEAEAVGEPAALAHASYALDWALVESGRPDQATHSWRALEIYKRLGDPEHEATVLNNLGMFAYFEGRWDEAVELYRQAGTRSERAGKPGDAAYTDCNVGEILSDQGRLSEASAHLERARRVWTATKEPQSVAFVNLLLGRVAVRAGRHQEAMPLLRAAMADLRAFRVDAYAGFARALIAEAEAFAGHPARALSIAREEINAAGRYVPLLHRICGIALVRLGRVDAAERELMTSLAVARERGEQYDIAATIDVIDVLGSARPSDAREREAILMRLKIDQLPRPPLP